MHVGNPQINKLNIFLKKTTTLNIIGIQRTILLCDSNIKFVKIWCVMYFCFFSFFVFGLTRVLCGSSLLVSLLVKEFCYGISSVYLLWSYSILLCVVLKPPFGGKWNVSGGGGHLLPSLATWVLSLDPRNRSRKLNLPEYPVKSLCQYASLT